MLEDASLAAGPCFLSNFHVESLAGNNVNSSGSRAFGPSAFIDSRFVEMIHRCLNRSCTAGILVIYRYTDGSIFAIQIFYFSRCELSIR